MLPAGLLGDVGEVLLDPEELGELPVCAHAGEPYVEYQPYELGELLPDGPDEDPPLHCPQLFLQ